MIPASLGREVIARRRESIAVVTKSDCVEEEEEQEDGKVTRLLFHSLIVQ